MTGGCSLLKFIVGALILFMNLVRVVVTRNVTRAAIEKRCPGVVRVTPEQRT